MQPCERLERGSARAVHLSGGCLSPRRPSRWTGVERRAARQSARECTSATNVGAKLARRCQPPSRHAVATCLDARHFRLGNSVGIRSGQGAGETRGVKCDPQGRAPGELANRLAEKPLLRTELHNNKRHGQARASQALVVSELRNLRAAAGPAILELGLQGACVYARLLSK